jgi:hypothetical protein
MNIVLVETVLSIFESMTPMEGNPTRANDTIPAKSHTSGKNAIECISDCMCMALMSLWAQRYSKVSSSSS